MLQKISIRFICKCTDVCGSVTYIFNKKLMLENATVKYHKFSISQAKHQLEWPEDYFTPFFFFFVPQGLPTSGTSFNLTSILLNGR